MGEHDLAALATMALVRRARARSSTATGAGPRLLARRDRRRRASGSSSALSLASLLGLYLAAVRVVGARARRAATCAAAPSLVTVAGRAAVTAGTLSLRSGELGFLQSWFGPPPEHAGPVRGELEPAADLRLHRRPHLPRPPGPRHRLVGRAAAGGVRAVPPRRARALLRPAAALLPASRPARSSRSRRTTRCSSSSASSARPLFLAARRARGAHGGCGPAVAGPGERDVGELAYVPGWPGSR